MSSPGDSSGRPELAGPSASFAQLRVRLQELARCVPLPLLVARADGEVDFVSEQWIETTGQRPEESSGHGWTEALHPDDRPRISAAWRGALAAGTPFEAEARCRTSAGGFQAFLLRGHPQHEEGAVTYWCLLWTNVERLKVAEREQRTRADAIVNTAVDSIITIDERGTIESVNPACEQTFGYSAAELAGRNVSLLMPEPYHSEHDGYIASYLQSRVPRIIGIGRDVTARRKDGSTFAIHLAVSEGKQAGRRFFTGVIRDVSEQERTERALNESRRALETLIANLPGMVYRCKNDRAWTMEFVSAGCRALTGHEPAELIANASVRFGDLIHPDDRELVWAQVQQALSERRSFTLSYRLRAASGEEKSIWEQGCGVFSEAGEVVAIEGFATDTTERKRLQDELLQSQKMEAVGRLAGGIAHDFNNLLMGVISTTRVITRLLPDDHEAQALLQETQHESYKGAGLARQLLDFSRKRPQRTRPVELNELLSEAQKMLQKLLGEDVELEVRLAPEGGRIVADPGQLDQILMNLAVNARDAMPDGGKLSMAVSEIDLVEEHAAHPASLDPGHYVVLTVTDAGCGMDEDTKSKIFEPFFTTKEVGKGTGLGLSTVFGLVQEFGGAIDVQSRVGEGTTFRLYFPRSNAPLADEPTSDASETFSGGENGTILVVEDEKLVRTGLQHLLGDLGYTVVTAADPEEALHLLATKSAGVDLLLTDMVMPGMSGGELAERVRELYPDVAVLFMSAYSAELLQEQGRLDAGQPLLEKPFDEDLLARTVRRLLG